MRKNTGAVIALVCALLALVCALLGLFRADRELKNAEARMAQLEIENQELVLQLEELEVQLEGMEFVAQEATDDESFCNLMVTQWHTEEKNLVIDEAFLQVQVPGVEDTSYNAKLVLKLNGESLQEKPMILNTSEIEGVYELDVTEEAFLLPELTAGDELELWLEADISAEATVESCGALWYQENGEIYLISG